MSYEPTAKERMEDARPYILPIVCGVLVLGVVGWVVWSQLGPNKRAKATPGAGAAAENPATAEMKRSLQSDVDALEKSYQRAVENNEPAAAIDSLLTRAIDRQREFLKLETQNTAIASERLARFETLRGDLRARTAAAESRALEKAAADDLASGRATAAAQKLREALRLQHDANSLARNQDLTDVAREVRLTEAVEKSFIEPLRATIAQARGRAQAAITAQDWSGALKAYEEARAAQAELNSKTPANRAANLAALEQLDTEIESLRAADLAAKVTAAEKAAATAETAGKPTEAAAALAAATQQQEEVNAKYPKSRFASAEKITELAVRRETVLSSEALGRVAILDREATALLRGRDPAAASKKISEATALVAKVMAEFPRSRALDPDRRRKLEYLELRRVDLEPLQKQVDAALTPLPGLADLQMFRTEVPQELYLRVMNINPSRNQGDTLPVDSVSWNDAREFCERLSWLLGAKVRLPREDEFRSAWKGAISGREWSAENAAGRSREIGRTPASAAGFVDVAGNVAEWLELPRDEGRTMPVAGGSFLDNAAALKQLPVEMVEKRTRSRHIGFRFVVEKSAGRN